MPVDAPETLIDKDVPVVITSSWNYYEIWKKLRSLGVQTILPYYFYKLYEGFDNNEDFAFWMPDISILRCINNLDESASDNALLLPSISLAITEKCSLNCRECASLVPYYLEPKDGDFEKFVMCMDHLLETVDGICEVNLLGGEPFVNPDLIKYIEKYADNKKIGNLTIISNGTIIPSKEVLKTLKHGRVKVMFSNYGVLSRKLNELKGIFDEEDIYYNILPYDSEKEWFRAQNFVYRNLGEKQLERVFSNCANAECWTLKDGRLHVCPYSAHAFALSALPAELNEGLDILKYSTQDLRKEIAELFQIKSLKICNYCLGRPKDGKGNIPAAEQCIGRLDYERY